MNRSGLPILSIPLLCAGCVISDSKTELVPSNPFGYSTAGPAMTQTSYAPAAVKCAARVDAMGRNLLAANSQLGMKPLFHTIGTPEAEIFHRGITDVYITEGLVNQCVGDGQLAAVLVLEFAKMVGEREKTAGRGPRISDRPPPLDVPVGNDFGGSFGSSDQVHRAELANYEKELRKKAESTGSLDPQSLAKSYLTKAGYAPTELDAVLPILDRVSNNRGLEKQLGSAPRLTLPAR
jgi:hypothetical protein